MEIKKAYSEDFEKIYPVLLLFDNPNITKEDWQKLFMKYWDSDRDYFGYYLEENNEVVGFFGLIFSLRQLDGKQADFCNMTSWIVKPEYRKYSLKLLNSVLAEENVVITN